jgi:uncharacterized protein YbbC (DUF1343 family)
MKKCFLLLLFCLPLMLNIQARVRVGAELMADYLPLLKGKRVALVVNQTSTVGNVHLLDTLLRLGVNVKKVFAPEHGFRGNADAGMDVSNDKDTRTGIPLVSIYGKEVKPTKEQLADVDVVVFDIQDVGTRFYTYISTMHYVMEACAENGKDFFVLDRPNPNDYVDGPVLKDKRFCSFVGVDALPILHGCTVGELARMINGEGWLANGTSCKLTVVKMKGWKHGRPYSLPVKPSPNLPNDRAVRLYPSLCLFEGTVMSVGRGTDFPFQVLGYPQENMGTFYFTPRPKPGMDKNPVLNDQKCYGLDLRLDNETKGFSLKYLKYFYTKSALGEKFFSNPAFFDKLAGTDALRKQIIEGVSDASIQASWSDDLKAYRQIRSKYLLY